MVHPEPEVELRRLAEDDPDLGLGKRHQLPGPDEERHAGPAPVLDVQPQRGERLGGRVGRDPGNRGIALVLAADVVRDLGGVDGPEQAELREPDRVVAVPGWRFHRRCGDDLHQMVHDHVAQRPDRVVEVSAGLYAERLGHGDLDGLDVRPVPQRLEDRVREPQIEDLLDPHLAEVVVDPTQLRLVDVLVQVGGQRPSRGEVVSERLLDHHPGRLRQARLREALDHGGEQEGRDLQVVNRVLEAPHGIGDPLIGRVVGEVAGHVRQPGRESREDLLVQLAGLGEDGLPGPLDELLGAPVVDRDADHRAGQQPAHLEPVERIEGHHLGEIAGDPEDHQCIGLGLGLGIGTGLGVGGHLRLRLFCGLRSEHIIGRERVRGLHPCRRNSRARRLLRRGAGRQDDSRGSARRRCAPGRGRP